MQATRRADQADYAPADLEAQAEGALHGLERCADARRKPAWAATCEASPESRRRAALLDQLQSAEALQAEAADALTPQRPAWSNADRAPHAPPRPKRRARASAGPAVCARFLDAARDRLAEIAQIRRFARRRAGAHGPETAPGGRAGRPIPSDHVAQIEARLFQPGGATGDVPSGRSTLQGRGRVLERVRAPASAALQGRTGGLAFSAVAKLSRQGIETLN